MTSEESLVNLRHRLELTARSLEFQRLSAQLESTTIASGVKQSLAAILVIEMTERPRPMRALEWIVWRVCNRLGVARMVGPRTLGPLQLAHAPSNFSAAASIAGSVIAGTQSDEDIAQRWYGATTRQPGCCASYPEVLSIARDVLRRRSMDNKSCTGVILRRGASRLVPSAR